MSNSFTAEVLRAHGLAADGVDIGTCRRGSSAPASAPRGYALRVVPALRADDSGAFPLGRPRPTDERLR